MDPAPELKNPLRRTPEIIVYRECMRNHAAALGGHAVDGCGSMMGSMTSPNLEFPLIKPWHYQLEELLFTDFHYIFMIYSYAMGLG
ncbi:hypothetical protein J5N97_017263 [Dioscorea zingiberensis]|uniref:ZF-HD dimerization-type domain-containing protein n=1 Tax=Dioscorea zingiberensis TaxID=325984 RepID=A0A9D5CKX0_9LILI|nr:hypothetical protein J5N97_017263 [Dioscorea zingiberensis]